MLADQAPRWQVGDGECVARPRPTVHGGAGDGLARVGHAREGGGHGDPDITPEGPAAADLGPLADRHSRRR